MLRDNSSKIWQLFIFLLVAFMFINATMFHLSLKYVPVSNRSESDSTLQETLNKYTSLSFK